MASIIPVICFHMLEEKAEKLRKYGIIQSMNSAGGRCHDNARCESMWARMKEELFYSRGDKSENYTKIGGKPKNRDFIKEDDWD